MILYRLLVRHLLIRTLLLVPGGPVLWRMIRIFVLTFAAGVAARSYGLL